MKAMVSGWPQLWLRPRRIACQVGPVSGSWTPPARQPWAWRPTGCGSWAEGVPLAANSDLAVWARDAETAGGGAPPQPPFAGVYLVGGSSRIPLLGRLVQERLGRTPINHDDDPGTAVAVGAADWARREAGIGVEDVKPPIIQPPITVPPPTPPPSGWLPRLLDGLAPYRRIVAAVIVALVVGGHSVVEQDLRRLRRRLGCGVRDLT